MIRLAKAKREKEEKEQEVRGERRILIMDIFIARDLDYLTPPIAQ
jgi:hypothetical protein